MDQSYSGMPQGSVMFSIYIDQDVESTVLMFAYNTKLIRNVESVEEAFTLQEDLQMSDYVC